MDEFELKLNLQDLQIIGAALGELPLKVSRPTFDKINAQVAAAQNTPPADPPVPPAD